MNLGIVLRSGPYQDQRWETAYSIANAALNRSHGVSIFLYMDGVYNALSTAEFSSMEKLPKDRLDSLLDHGAEVYACMTCTSNRGLEEGKDYLKRVKVKGATQASEMVSECDRIISL